MKDDFAINQAALVGDQRGQSVSQEAARVHALAVERVHSSAFPNNNHYYRQQEDLDTVNVGELLVEPDSRPGIAGTAYDTAWLASVPDPTDETRPRFPMALQWLAQNQMQDGSWGGAVRYEHDRILSTLAALVPLTKYDYPANGHKCITAGTRYLWQRGHALADEPTELVAFELLLPAMIQRAQQAGLQIPPHLDIYAKQRVEKMSLIPVGSLYSPRVTIVHSLEFLGDRADLAGLQAAQGANGSIGNSPAATAFYYARSKDPHGLAYLEGCISKFGNAQAPVLFPCETYELLWSAYHLFLAGVPAAQLLNQKERVLLGKALKRGGVSLSPSFPIPDADDTAVALLLLHDLGESPDPSVLERFALAEGNFASFQFERHSSVGVSLHVLHALLRVPGYPEHTQAIERILDYLSSQQVGGLYWLDKWHISPYYATAHALCVLNELPAKQAARMRPLVETSREWLRQTQNRDGSWGNYGTPTAEETAYGLLALATCWNVEVLERDYPRCVAAAHYLQSAIGEITKADSEVLPPLWVDKCLYTPTLIVRTVIASALEAYRRMNIEINIAKV